MTPDNFLIAEPLLLDRLKAFLPAEVHVLAAADLQEVAASNQPVPAVHVVYAGYGVTDASTGAATLITQHWLTIIVTRNVADVEQGFHARQAAGPLAGRVMDALYRHRLKNEGKFIGSAPMRPIDAPSPGFADGHFYLPLGWAVPINFSSDTCPT